MKIKISSIYQENENGNILSFVVVLLMCMSLLAGTSMTLAKKQLMMAHFSKQTSNSYYLARSGAEKIVDSMNKEIASQLPRLMKEAADKAKEKLLLTTHNNDCITYSMEKGIDPYLGKYVARELSEDYQVRLRQLSYEHIIEVFSKKLNKTGLMDYNIYSDVVGDKPIKITSKVYYKGCSQIPEDLKEIVGGLAKQVDINKDNQDFFAIEVIARAQDADRISLTKSRVIATVKLDQMMQQDEELLEEYQWADDGTSEGNYPQILELGEGSFEDVMHLIDLSVFQNPNQWSYNNPIHVLTQSETIDVSQFYQVPTAIIGINSDVCITFRGSEAFNGIIITPGKVEIEDEMLINGVIIVGNEEDAQIISPQINHDKDMILKIRCMDKSLQRRLYDCLKLTNYRDANNGGLAGMGQQEIMNRVIGDQASRIIKLSPLSVISSTQEGTWFTIQSLRKLS